MSSEPETTENLSFFEICTLTRENWTSVLCIAADTIPPADELIGATTIVSFGASLLLSDRVQHLTIPPTIPILILLDPSDSGEKNSLDRLYASPNKLVDFLHLPVRKSHLISKVNFLRHVHTLAIEHHRSVSSHRQQLDFLSNYDGLTGLRNRRQFTNDLAQEMAIAVNKKRDLTLMVFNIDLFSEINKNYGLDSGDLILNELAARATETVKRPWKCYRYSTDDFAALLPDNDLEMAGKVAEQLRKNCAVKPFRTTTQKIPVTISIGLASYALNQPKDYEKFIFMAETALFKAKATGRNRAMTYLSQVGTEPLAPPNPLLILKEKLSRILDKTRTSAIESLQHLARSLTGPEHKKHAERVLQYSQLLSARMGLPEMLLQTYENSIAIYTSFRFLLHDELLSKPGKLTRDEWKVIEDLPFKLKELTEIFDYFSKERTLLIYQSENYDGSGYPEGRRGEEIPLGARMLKLVDAFAAMNGERPYRKTLRPEEIIDELLSGAGKQFDPKLVLQLFRIIAEHELLKIPDDSLRLAIDELSENLKKLTL